MLSAIDRDEEQRISIIGQDIDEIQLIRTSGDNIPEIQKVEVSVDRVNDVQKLGILISGIGTNIRNNNTFAGQVGLGLWPGEVHPMNCKTVSGINDCFITTTQNSSLLGGKFQLITSWPHEYIQENPITYLSESI